MQALYQKMGGALEASGRPILFGLCQYGMYDVGAWGEKAGGNLAGIVLNNINMSQDESYYYYSGYHYHSNNNEVEPAANGKPTGRSDRRKPHGPTEAAAPIKPKY